MSRDWTLALRRLVGWFFAPTPVLHRFDPAECRERQRAAAIAAAFVPHTPAARRQPTNQEGFQ